MSDGELAQLVCDGRDSLTHNARQALDAELASRGLSDDALLTQYPSSRKPRKVEEGNARLKRSVSLKEYRLAGVPYWKLGIVLLSLAVVVISAGIHVREAKLNELYSAAMEIDTAKSRAALEQLATYRGKNVDALLMKVANSGPYLSENEVIAIGLLGKRGNAATAEELAAKLLHPYQSLVVRKAVADSLSALPCSGECIRSVLDYEERIWRDEPTPESDFRAASSSFEDSVQRELEKEREQIDEKLSNILVRQRGETVQILIRTHGLGGASLSPFALQTVRRLKLTETCGLLDIDRQFKPEPLESELMPGMAKRRGEINRARTDLGCPVPPAQPPLR